MLPHIYLLCCERATFKLIIIIDTTCYQTISSVFEFFTKVQMEITQH
jgi:hypothetical protein